MSLDRMIGYESGMKDDLESIVLLLIFLLRGKLPWTEAVNKINSYDTSSELES
jgi:hypothetical protein